MHSPLTQLQRCQSEAATVRIGRPGREQQSGTEPRPDIDWKMGRLNPTWGTERDPSATGEQRRGPGDDQPAETSKL